jgi:hypothetical protein
MQILILAVELPFVYDSRIMHHPNLPGKQVQQVSRPHAKK